MPTGNNAAPGLPPTLSLHNRRVLVTGAASGIGQATAICLAELGAEVILSDIASSEETEAAIGARGGLCAVRRGDLTDQSYCDSLVAEGPYFAFANVAGVFQGRPGDDDDAGFDFVMHVNLRAPVRLAFGLIDQMAAQGEGYVVLVGSAAGRNGGASNEASLAYAAYAASKGGVHTLVRWLSRRAVGKNVLVNGVAPGVVKTPLFDRISTTVRFDPKVLPMGRYADPVELGWPIALLCTRAASYVSGAILDVNGGTFVG